MQKTQTTYLPFGELQVNQQYNNNYDSRFKFTAKEHDPATNYTYFGARYYDSDASIWLSVDPLSDKAPAWTPYRYGFQNPIRFTDPTGLYEDKSKAERKQERLGRRMERRGQDASRVGDVYDRNEGTGKKADWGFNVYYKGDSKNDKNTSTVVEATIGANKPALNINSNRDLKSFKRNYIGKRSFLEKSDDLVPYAARLTTKLFTPIAQIDAGNTLIYGVDLNGNEQTGLLDRYISPTITIGAGFAGFLNFGGLINLSTKTKKAINRIDRVNTIYSGGKEAIDIIYEK